MMMNTIMFGLLAGCCLAAFDPSDAPRPEGAEAAEQMDYKDMFENHKLGPGHEITEVLARMCNDQSRLTWKKACDILTDFYDATTKERKKLLSRYKSDQTNIAVEELYMKARELKDNFEKAVERLLVQQTTQTGEIRASNESPAMKAHQLFLRAQQTRQTREIRVILLNKCDLAIKLWMISYYKAVKHLRHPGKESQLFKAWNELLHSKQAEVEGIIQENWMKATRLLTKFQLMNGGKQRQRMLSNLRGKLDWKYEVHGYDLHKFEDFTSWLAKYKRWNELQNPLSSRPAKRQKLND